MSLLTIREASKALAVSQRHIRRMISKGQWPFYRAGNRIIRLDLEEIKNVGRVVAKAEKEK